jgi:hypothetical protein
MTVCAAVARAVKRRLLA